MSRVDNCVFSYPQKARQSLFKPFERIGTHAHGLPLRIDTCVIPITLQPYNGIQSDWGIVEGEVGRILHTHSMISCLTLTSQLFYSIFYGVPKRNRDPVPYTSRPYSCRVKATADTPDGIVTICPIETLTTSLLIGTRLQDQVVGSFQLPVRTEYMLVHEAVVNVRGVVNVLLRVGEQSAWTCHS